jgi:hypothetical protein
MGAIMVTEYSHIHDKFFAPVNLTRRYHFDVVSYRKYRSRQLEDFWYPAEIVTMAMKILLVLQAV